MKPLHICLIYMLFMPWLCKAQQKTQGRATPLQVSTGVYIGANNVFSLQALQYKGMNFFTMSHAEGLYLEIKMDDKWRVELAPGFARFGGKYMLYSHKDLFDSAAWSVEVLRAATYFQVPMMLKYKVSQRGDVIAGFSFGFYVSDEADFYDHQVFGGIPDDFASHGWFFDPDLAGSDFWIMAGYQWKVTDRVNIAAIASVGTVKLMDDTEINTINASPADQLLPPLSGMYNNSLMLRLSYSFHKPAGR